jgi:hypothetical protein
LLPNADWPNVTRGSILRFFRGDQSLRLDKADALAAYYGGGTHKTKGQVRMSIAAIGLICIVPLVVIAVVALVAWTYKRPKE